MLEKTLTEDEHAEQFIQLLAQHERGLAAYVMTFVASAADADDILQDTKLWLWRSFDQFELGSSFGAWARQAAFYRIQQYFRKRGKERSRRAFSDDCLEQLATQYERRSDSLDERAERLSHCVDRLSSAHRRILTLRYREGLVVDEIARRTERTVSATYRVLSRIRMALRQCVAGGTTGVPPFSEAES